MCLKVPDVGVMKSVLNKYVSEIDNTYFPIQLSEIVSKLMMTLTDNIFDDRNDLINNRILLPSDTLLAHLRTATSQGFGSLFYKINDMMITLLE